MKFAYLIVTHKEPEQFIRLLQTIDSDESLFYIHVDKKVDIEPFKKVEEVIDPKKIIWLKRKSIIWAGFNMIRATLDGLHEILNSKEQLSHVTLLSGQDYPIKPIAAYHDYLIANYGKDYIETSEMPRKGWQSGGMDRILYHHLIFPKFRIAYPLLSYLNVKLRYREGGKWDLYKKIVGFLPKQKDFPREFLKNTKPYEGSQWWTLSILSVKNIVNFLNNDPTFYNYFKYTHVADEIFFPTLVKNNNINIEENIINNNLRHIDWNSNTGHPRTLDMTDKEVLLNSSAFFARKFDMDSEILSWIDKELLKKDSL
ncbi:MAG: beta-1,6-N-acetylglucosaminyltransferase [Mucilaginibacter sp.]